MIYRMFFEEGEIEVLKDFINIDDYAAAFNNRSFAYKHILKNRDCYYTLNSFLVFSNRIYCEDKHKLEELQNLFILMGGKFSGKFNYGSESESARLLIDCIKLLGEL